MMPRWPAVSPWMSAILAPRKYVMFNPLAVFRHRVAYSEVQHEDEDVGLDAVSRPDRVLSCCRCRAQNIEKADDSDEGRVLERPDDLVHHRGQNDARHLRENSPRHLLPVGQADGIGR